MIKQMVLQMLSWVVEAVGKIFLSSSVLALTLVSISRVIPGHLFFGQWQKLLC